MSVNWLNLFEFILDENQEKIANFLIRSGCDINAARRPGPTGGGGDAAQDLQTPLHMCCSWGLLSTVITLLEHGVKVNNKVCQNLCIFIEEYF